MSYLNIATVALLSLIVAGCGQPNSQSPSPTTTDVREIKKGDKALQQKGAYLYYEEKLLTGTVTLHHESGQLLSCFAYLAGKIEGKSISFHADGSAKSESHYQNNRKMGIYRAWWPNGKERKIAHYENGVYEGSVEEWIEDGTPYLSKNYSNGKEDGIQKMWYLDGTLRANYEVRNNRRYGWIGGLACTSTLKEVLDKKE
jgi:antitoxin component YwqK of YwqJK toxin-antitoxin module